MGEASDSLINLLQAVSSGGLSPEEALQQLKYFSYEPLDDFARIDHHRALRTGFPEFIWGPGKTIEQLTRIFEAFESRGEAAIATRIERSTYESLTTHISNLVYFEQARICSSQDLPASYKYSGTIGVLSAGTSDLPVAKEAQIIAQYCGFEVRTFWDIGVAGIHRLLRNVEAIAQCDVLIVVAGMEGALASVVAGLVDSPVVAVPTSVGYGTQFNGLTPLLTMLNSCATGIGVVNIDNGFGAALLAGKILKRAQNLKT